MINLIHRYMTLVLLVFLPNVAFAEAQDSIIISMHMKHSKHGYAATSTMQGKYIQSECLQGEGGTQPTLFIARGDSAIKLYNKNQIKIRTITPGKLRKIVFRFQTTATSLKEGYCTVSSGNYDAASYTWEGENDLVIFTMTLPSKTYIHLTSVHIYLSEENLPNPIPTLNSLSDLRMIAENERIELNIRNGKVLYTEDGKTYVSDNSGIVCIKNQELTWQNNDILNGVVEGIYHSFQDCPTLQVTDNTQISRLTVTSSPIMLNPTDITVDQLKDNAYQYVCLKEITPDRLKVSDFFNLNTTLPYPGALFNVTGYVLPLPAAEGTGETSYHVCPIARNGIEFLFKDKMQNAVSEASRIRVKLTRTLLADTWNTLCLPFSVSASQINSIFGKTRIREFEKVENDVFLFKECDSIQGGKPYLFNPSRTVADPCFDDVTLVSQPQSIMNGGYGFVGVFSPYEMQTDGTQLFLNNGNLKKPSVSSNKMAGMRAYFVIPSVDALTKSFSLDNTLTSIKNIPKQPQDSTAIYRLDGRKLNKSKAELRKGIYIIGGQKMIIP